MGPICNRLLGLLCAFVLYGLIMKYPAGKGDVVKIGDQIHLGAKVFMITEYKILTPVVIALVIACGLSPLGWYTATAIAVGALSSAIAGFIGMYSATQANVRTATAAENSAKNKLYLFHFLVAQLWVCVCIYGAGWFRRLIFLLQRRYGRSRQDSKILRGFGVGASAVALSQE